MNNNLKPSNVSVYTLSEIKSQPGLWPEVFNSVCRDGGLSDFLTTTLAKKPQIIFTGAGTSSFAADLISRSYFARTGVICQSSSTTDILTNPNLHIKADHPLLIVSVARSGNSPESAAAVKVAEEISGNVFNLVITCNPVSGLIDILKKEKSYVLLMPEGANDKGLAMTASFSSMVLAGLFLSRLNVLSEAGRQVKKISDYAKTLISEYDEVIRKVCKKKFGRGIFLGSGYLKYIAEESQLKLQELTSGKVICKHDSFLGFRHGPKVVADDKSLVVYLLSGNPYVKKYEKDLIYSGNGKNNSLHSIAVSPRKIENLPVDTQINFTSKPPAIDNDLLSIPFIIVAQLLGYYKSVELGLNPDNPSPDGTISRVVQGVKTYPYSGKYSLS